VFLESLDKNSKPGACEALDSIISYWVTFSSIALIITSSGVSSSIITPTISGSDVKKKKFEIAINRVTQAAVIKR
jgi:hypothetical protein